MQGVCGLIDKFNTFIINPLLLLFFAAGVLVFLWGVVEFIWGLSSESETRENGKRHMLWGLVGVFVMTAAWAIVKLIAVTVGANLTCNL